ncbi:hypothetical protein Pelo_19571 [Pelomyxa schiedti]|nr:hypothetical protein Pelo_19571 [Pelomyxa schiedti]
MYLLDFHDTHIKHRVDMSLTQLMIKFNTEITGVMEILDIQSLGRVQQTSRFWYQCGRTNDLWRRALFNSSREWNQTARQKVDKCLASLPEATTKWKHVCFFWTSKNMCTKCRKVYRNRDPVTLTTTKATKATPTATPQVRRHVHNPRNVRFFSGSTLLYDILQTETCKSG